MPWQWGCQDNFTPISLKGQGVCKRNTYISYVFSIYICVYTHMYIHTYFLTATLFPTIGQENPAGCLNQRWYGIVRCFWFEVMFTGNHFEVYLPAEPPGFKGWGCSNNSTMSTYLRGHRDHQKLVTSTSLPWGFSLITSFQLSSTYLPFSSGPGDHSIASSIPNHFCLVKFHTISLVLTQHSSRCCLRPESPPALSCVKVLDPNWYGWEIKAMNLITKGWSPSGHWE